MFVRIGSSPEKLAVTLAIALLIFAVFVRFLASQRTPIWTEESYGIEAILGIEAMESWYADLPEEKIIPASAWRGALNANRGPTIFGTLNYLLRHDRQHFPAYYLVANMWAQVFGVSKFSLRLLSILGSMLTLLGCILLLRALNFEFSLALLCTSVFSITPLFVFYDYMIREYSFWVTTIVWTLVAGVRFLRNPTLSSGGILCALLTLGNYTFLFSLYLPALLTLALVWQRFKNGNWRLSYTDARNVFPMIASVLLFLPYMYFFYKEFQKVRETTRWMEVSRFHWWNEFKVIGQAIVGTNVELVFAVAISALLSVIIIVHFKKFLASWQGALCLATFLIPAVLMTLADSLMIGRFSFTPRYNLLTMVGFFLSFCFMISQNWLPKFINRGILTLWIAGSVYACVKIVDNPYVPELSKHKGAFEAIEYARNNPLPELIAFVSGKNPSRALMFLQTLPPEQKTVIVPSVASLEKFSDADSIWLYRPSKTWLKKNKDKKLQGKYLYQYQ